MDWFIRFNLTREKNYIEEYKDLFSGVIVDAHILETFPNAVANFLALLEKPFIIDPVTYRFSVFNNIDLYAEKRWYPVLQSYFFGDTLGELEQLTDDYFSDEESINKYVNRVMNYQRTRLGKLLDNLEIFGVSSSLPPSILIPPYSIIMNRSDPWLNINVQCIRESIKSKKDGEKIYAVIPIFKDLLHNDSFIDSLISNYNIADLDGYFIWVADFKEEREDENCLKKYLTFFRKLSEMQKPVINFYGGFLSMVASSRKMLSGFSFALCYAEHRNPFTGGGPMPTRYYLDQFHVKIPKDEVEGVLILGELDRCECEMCQQYEDLEGIDLMSSLKHFIIARRNEIGLLNDGNLDAVINSLENLNRNMRRKDRQQVYISHYRHLERWIVALNSIQN